MLSEFLVDPRGRRAGVFSQRLAHLLRHDLVPQAVVQRPGDGVRPVHVEPERRHPPGARLLLGEQHGRAPVTPPRSRPRTPTPSAGRDPARARPATASQPRGRRPGPGTTAVPGWRTRGGNSARYPAPPSPARRGRASRPTPRSAPRTRPPAAAARPRTLLRSAGATAARRPSRSHLIASPARAREMSAPPSSLTSGGVMTEGTASQNARSVAAHRLDYARAEVP